MSGGFLLRNVEYGSVTEQWSLPTPFADDGVATGWQAAINDGGANKEITAYVLCVPE